MNATKHSRPADPAAAAVVAREADARAMKILKERLWHFTSIGLGNCRAAQAVEREIRLLTEGNKGSSQGNYSSDSTSGGNALANVARDGDARGLKILKERLWHFTSIGLGNCRAAQQARREIEQRQQAHSGTGEDTRATKNLATPPQHQLANQSIEQLTAGLSHLVSVGLANSCAAQKISYELSRRLLIRIASLTNDDNFNPNEPRDQDGKWTIGTNASGSATNTPTQAPPPRSAPAQRDDDDDTDDIPLTFGEAHAKQRRSAGEASAQLYDEGRAGMKAAAATGRAAAEMNPIIAFFHGIYQALVGKDAIDPNKHLTAGERWKSGGSAALAAAPTGLKALGAAKVLVEAGEAAEGIKKAEGVIAEAGEIKKAESAVVKAEQAGQEVKKAEEAGAGAAKAAEDTKDPIHHIATDKNWASTARGGPWSPKFEELFNKAGMTLQDGMNKISLAGHYGPHPEAYHAAVFKRLQDATEGLSGDAYVKAFKSELTAIANEVKTPGTYLNKLLTE